jgi:hypothetical protein
MRQVPHVNTLYHENIKFWVVLTITISDVKLSACAEINSIIVNVNQFYLLVMAKVPSSLILVTLMMEALNSSETSVLGRAT